MGQQETQLFVHCHGLDSDTEDRVAEVMEELELPVSSTEGSSGMEYVQMTNKFPSTGVYETKVESLYERFQSEFDELTVKKSIGEGAGYQHLPFDWIYEIIVLDEDSYKELRRERQEGLGDDLLELDSEKLQERQEGVGKIEDDFVESPYEEDSR
jgi:hypothetical protein